MPLGARNLQSLFVGFYSAALFAIGVWHIVAGPTTERLFSQPSRVRPVGAALLALALPCLCWGGFYFEVMAVIFAASGAMRLITPGFNVWLQKAAYPRWVHGWIMVSGGLLSWLCYQWLGPGIG